MSQFKSVGEYEMFECPGCKTMHGFRVRGEGPKPKWAWDGKTTFSPSLLVSDNEGTLCHSFVKDGKIQFLGDCKHDLKNQTIEIPEWED